MRDLLVEARWKLAVRFMLAVLGLLIHRRDADLLIMQDLEDELDRLDLPE